MACVKAAMAHASSTLVVQSHIRNSSVTHVGCGRTSHQIFLPLSMQLSRTSRFTKFSYALHDSNNSGTPVRGNRRNTVVRKDFRPVFRPIQNGELVESDSRCGRKYRTMFIMSMVVCLSGIATWMCMPKITSDLPS